MPVDTKSMPSEWNEPSAEEDKEEGEKEEEAAAPQRQPVFVTERRSQREPVSLGGLNITYFKHSWERYKFSHREKEEWEQTNDGIEKLLLLLQEMKRHGWYDRPVPGWMTSGDARLVMGSGDAFVRGKRRNATRT